MFFSCIHSYSLLLDTKYAVYLLLLCLTAQFSHAVDPTPLLLGYLTADDKTEMKTFFESHFSAIKNEHAKAYHVALGLSSLGISPKDPGFCQASGSVKTPDVAFYRASIASLTGNEKCKVGATELQDVIKSKLVETASAEDVFYLVSAMKESGLEVDKSKVMEIINKLKAKDSSASTMAYIFQTVVKLNLSKASLKPFLDAINDVLDQGDELNGNQLFFERGIFTTSMVAKGVVELINAYGEFENVPEVKLVKLINFIYNRRHSTNLRAAAYLAASLKAFSSVSFVTPVAIALGAQPPANSKERFATGGELHRASTKIQLRLVSLWGDTLSPSTVALKAAGLYAVRGPNKVRVLTGPTERGSFSSPNGKSYFELPLTSNDGSLPTANWYELELSAQPKGTKSKQKFLGVTGVQLPLRVLVNAKVVEPVLKVGDGAHDKYQTEIKLKPGSRTTGSGASGSIPIETGQRLLLSLQFADEVGEAPLTAHQAFVQFTHLETGQSITFICNEIDAIGKANTKIYQLKLDPEGSADDFDNVDGIYKMELLAGDSLFLKPLVWHMADVNMHFTGPRGSDSARRAAEASDVSRLKTTTTAGMKRAGEVNPLIGMGPTKAKPGIEHVFRPPERRAPRPLAWAFTALCAVPLLGLLISWAVIGINLWNFRFSLSAIIFHLGLIAILVLYYIYWCYLDMFTTLGYLSLLSVPTFLAGNSVLRTQLAARQAATSGSRK